MGPHTSDITPWNGQWTCISFKELQHQHQVLAKTFCPTMCPSMESCKWPGKILKPSQTWHLTYRTLSSNLPESGANLFFQSLPPYILWIILLNIQILLFLDHSRSWCESDLSFLRWHRDSLFHAWRNQGGIQLIILLLLPFFTLFGLSAKVVIASISRRTSKSSWSLWEGSCHVSRSLRVSTLSSRPVLKVWCDMAWQKMGCHGIIS